MTQVVERRSFASNFVDSRDTVFVQMVGCVPDKCSVLVLVPEYPPASVLNILQHLS